MNETSMTALTNTTDTRNTGYQPLVCANAVDDGTGYTLWATIVRGGVGSTPIQVEIYETRRCFECEECWCSSVGDCDKHNLKITRT